MKEVKPLQTHLLKVKLVQVARDLSQQQVPLLTQSSSPAFSSDLSPGRVTSRLWESQAHQ